MNIVIYTSQLLDQIKTYLLIVAPDPEIIRNFSGTQCIEFLHNLYPGGIAKFIADTPPRI